MSERYKYNREGYLNENFRMFHLRDTAGQERDFHFHEFDKIVILISGSVNYMVEGTDYTLEPWDILLVRHHMIHKALIDVSVPYERIIIYLDSAYVERFAPDGGLMDCFAEAEKRRFCLMRPDADEIEKLKDSLDRLGTSISDTEFGAETHAWNAACAADGAAKPHNAARHEQQGCLHRAKRQDIGGSFLYK